MAMVVGAHCPAAAALPTQFDYELTPVADTGGRQPGALAYTIIDAQGQERVIAWFPAGAAHRPLQQVMLTPGLSDARRAVCVRAVSGE